MIRKIDYLISWGDTDVWSDEIPCNHLMLECGHDIWVYESDYVSEGDKLMVDCFKCDEIIEELA